MVKPAVIAGIFSFALLSFTTQALDFEFGSDGYLRTSKAISAGGNTQECYRAPGSGAKYRLGNECELWSEVAGFMVTKDGEEGPSVRFNIMSSFLGPDNRSVDFFRFQEMYVEASDLFPSMMPGAKFWLGRRYYDRKDIHINDYFYLDMSGDGVGVRDWDIGIGKFAYAYVMDDFESSDSATQHSHDFRLYDIPVNKDGSLFLFAGYSYIDGGEIYEGEDGFAFTLQHTQENFLGGHNKLAFQYGEGTSFNAGQGLYIGDDAVALLVNSQAASDLEDAKAWRIVNHSLYDSDQWAMMTAFVYEERDYSSFNGVDQSWLSVGVRPVWYTSNNTRLILELGHDRVDDKQTGVDGGLTKVTMAVELAYKKGFWQRPVLRVFGTYGSWSDDWRGQVGGDTYADKTEGWSVGINFEHWW